MKTCKVPQDSTSSAKGADVANAAPPKQHIITAREYTSTIAGLRFAKPAISATFDDADYDFVHKSELEQTGEGPRSQPAGADGKCCVM